jgi:hypothetical protein
MRSANFRNQWIVYSNELLDRLRVSNLRAAVRCVECDFGDIVRDGFELSCRKVNQCAKLWLMRKARRFRITSVDEILGTVLVHIAGKLERRVNAQRTFEVARVNQILPKVAEKSTFFRD